MPNLKPVMLVNGVDAVRAANQIHQALQGRRDAWPYLHSYAPPGAEDVNVVGYAATETVGTGPIQVVSYTVNSGKLFYLRGVILGANVTIAPGAATFTVDRNSPVGVTNTQYMPEHGLVAVPFQLGSFTQMGPWILQMPRIFMPLDVVRIKGTNVSLSVGAPNYYQCGLFGFEIPILDMEPQSGSR